MRMSKKPNKKWAMFLEWVKSEGATTRHLNLLLQNYPQHRYKNEIVAELERRAQCQLNSNQANESTKAKAEV